MTTRPDDPGTERNAARPDEERADSAGASHHTSADGGQPGRRARRGQARRGVLARLLSGLGALLTLLTAVAILTLVARPPSSPAAFPPPAAGDAAPGGNERPIGDAGANLGDLVPRLVALAANPGLGWLRGLASTVRPEGVRLTDMRFTLADTPLGASARVLLDEVRLRPQADGWRADLAGRIDGEPAVAFEGVARLVDHGGGAQLRVVLAELDLGALLRRAAPQVVRAAEGAGAVMVETRLADGNPAEPVDVTIRLTAPGRVRLAGMPEALPVTMLEAALRQHAGGVTVERAALASPAFRVAGRGEVDGERLTLAIAADAVDAGWAPRLWPAGVAAGARDWVTANITGGRISRLDLAVDVTRAELAAGGLPADALAGEARIDDAEIHYLRPMPPATGADATARFDGERVVFAITRGIAAGVEVTGGEVVISDLATPDTVERLEVRLDGRGSVPAILALTDHEPLALASRKNLPVAGSAGSGRFDLRVGLPLLRDLPLDAVRLQLDGRFEDVTLPGLAAGRDLTDAEVTLDATVDRVEASGRGRVAGVPLELGFEATGAREVLRARGEVEAAQLGALGSPPLPLRGTVGIDATVTSDGDEERSELRLDVGSAEVDVPRLAVWKPAGVPGSVEVVVVERAGTVAVERLAVDWPGAAIGGAAELDTGGRLQTVTLDPFRVAGTELRVIGTRADGTLALQIEGPRLDLDPFAAGGGGAGGIAGTATWSAQTPVTIAFAVDEVVVGGIGALTAVGGRLRADRRGLTALRLEAGIRPGEGTVTLRFEPSGDEERIALTTTDLGGLTAALGLTDTVRGGRFDFVGRLTGRRPEPRVTGEITARDFVVGGAPPIVRLLAAAPETADLADDDLAVSRFTSPIALSGEMLTLDDALLIASNLALRAAGEVDLAGQRLDLTGSLAPVQGLNRFIGDLPLIGALLQGAKKAGAFALSFTARGPWADPRVEVNPLSVVTPGLLQDLFAGAGEPRRPLPGDDD